MGRQITRQGKAEIREYIHEIGDIYLAKDKGGDWLVALGDIVLRAGSGPELLRYLAEVMEEQ